MRIMIATVTAGAGHLQAAGALEEAWKTVRPRDTVERIDLLEHVFRLQRKVYIQTYVKLVEHAPEIWGMMFNKTDNSVAANKLGRLRRAFARRTNRRFVKHLKEFNPDVVICTHYLPIEILGHLKSKRRCVRPFVACVVTDFEAHAFWMDDFVELYCVAAAETKASLVARGASPEHVVATGIPIAAKFSTRPQPRSVRKTLGLRDDVPVLLVLGGGFGMGPVANILDALDRVERPLQVLVVAGRNEELRRTLACHDYRHPTRTFGFATNMHELMAVANLIITKPGGLTSSEALAMGKPLFILNPIPGQETANSDFLLERGAAAKVNRIDDLPFRLEQLLASGKLSAMARAARKLGRPNAAMAICRQITQRISRPR